MCPTLTGEMWEEVTYVTMGGHVKSEYGVCQILFSLAMGRNLGSLCVNGAFSARCQPPEVPTSLLFPCSHQATPAPFPAHGTKLSGLTPNMLFHLTHT